MRLCCCCMALIYFLTSCSHLMWLIYSVAGHEYSPLLSPLSSSGEKNGSKLTMRSQRYLGMKRGGRRRSIGP